MTDDQIKDVSLTTTAGKDMVFIEIPVEAIIDGEVVTVNTKALPLIKKEQ